LTIKKLENLLLLNSSNLTQEFKRLFHGRGGCYEWYKFLTIDSIDTILNIAFYFNPDKEFEMKLLDMLKKFINITRHTTIVLQRRYIKGTTSEIIVGNLDDDIYALQNGIKIKLNLLSNQNSGYFPDMKKGRELIKENSKDKNVLNLFSYTCAFSLSAISGGAKSVTNIDMSKSSLTIGRTNHHLNNFDTKNINFLPHNILKSFGKIKRLSPFDIIIIDPPTFQRGSFEVTKDYTKIIKRLVDFASPDCIVLACLNSPDLNSQYLMNIFQEFTPQFKFIKKLDNVAEFVAIDDEKSLKNLIFKRVKN